MIPTLPLQHALKRARRISSLSNASTNQFEEFFKIYSEALPASERKTRAEIEKLVNRSDYIVRVMEGSEGVIAFSIVYISRNGSFALLEYMATRSGKRNQGIGSEMFRQCLAANNGRLIIVEVDSDREYGSDITVRARRKAFYKRLGCHEFRNLPYILPLETCGQPPMMDLLVHFNGKAPAISREALRSFLQDIYVTVYSQRPNDGRISLMLKGVQERVAFI